MATCRECYSLQQSTKTKKFYPVNTDPTVMKTCTTCGKSKPATLENFHRYKSGTYGIVSECKECKSIKHKQRPIITNTDPTITKRCTQCKKQLPATLDYFYKLKSGRHGLTGQCKECERYRQSQLDNPANTNRDLVKTCSCCRNIKSATVQYFRESKTGKFGIQSICRECEKLKSQKYYRSPHGKRINRIKASKRRSRKNNPTQQLGVPNNDLIKQIYYSCPEGYDVDHIMPISKGGQHHESNLCYLPQSINSSKGAKTVEEFGVETFNKNVIYWQNYLGNDHSLFNGQTLSDNGGISTGAEGSIQPNDSNE